eukprot:952533-Pyramimonas_sp.AAC.1
MGAFAGDALEVCPQTPGSVWTGSAFRIIFDCPGARKQPPDAESNRRCCVFSSSTRLSLVRRLGGSGG